MHQAFMFKVHTLSCEKDNHEHRNAVYMLPQHLHNRIPQITTYPQ